MQNWLIKGGTLFNRGKRFQADVLIKNGRIEKVLPIIEAKGVPEINAEGKWILPGLIDSQVHFREPGLTHKANIGSESRAGVAGGVTSFMEMPNTVPAATSLELLEEKYAIAAKRSPANYSFFMGTSNSNLEDIKKIDPKHICGLKIFMGSSTGNLVVDDPVALENAFRFSPVLISTHCEYEPLVKARVEAFLAENPNADVASHPIIRNEEVCWLSTEQAIGLAKSTGARLHILHISTEKEIRYLVEMAAQGERSITFEVCVHHLWFSADDYKLLGNQIKCNPAIKASNHRSALREMLKAGKLQCLATDHAPHTWEEKSKPYSQAPAGLPLLQHSLQMMLSFVDQGFATVEEIVRLGAHEPANLFQIENRGYLDEGYWADLVIVDPNKSYQVSKENLLYHCGWSPLEGYKFKHSIDSTYVNGFPVWQAGRLNEGSVGMRLSFNR